LEAKKKQKANSKKGHPSEVLGVTNQPMSSNSGCGSSGMATCNKSCCKSSL
jgi:hypothetical protein